MSKKTPSFTSLPFYAHPIANGDFPIIFLKGLDGKMQGNANELDVVWIPLK
jgi:hypothetical protein